jgi:hypothetical protein
MGRVEPDLGRALGPAGPRLHSALPRMGRVVIMIISARGPTGSRISTKKNTGWSPGTH